MAGTNGTYAAPAARPLPTEEGRRVVEARHPEHVRNLTVWRWLQDSLEGGEQYRDADYGTQLYIARWVAPDPATGQERQYSYHHQLPRRNLIRHPHEYPQGQGPGELPAYNYEGPASAPGDEYEFRRALTPVPSFVSEAIGIHLAKIYAREVKREAPEGPRGDALRAWWADVDGSGTSIDDWMQETIAPLFLSLGQIDLAFDHPPPPSGEVVASQADNNRLRLSRCVASYIIPDNVTDWGLDEKRRYSRVVVREYHDGECRYRQWTPEGSVLYDDRGAELGRTEHRFGRVPIVRCFDTRKPRQTNIGQPRYEPIADLQRAYYNVDSELTLSNSFAAHPLLSGPQDFCSGQTIKVGPGNVLPKFKAPGGASHEGWEYVSPPSEASEKLAAKLDDYRDRADRAACLTKPAGAKGTDGNTVSQSGISKALDQSTGNDLLSKISKSLQRLEMHAVEMVLTVLGDRLPSDAELALVKVTYPTRFDLFTADTFAKLVEEWQAIVADAGGDLPETTGHLLRTYVRLMLPGMDDEAYAEIDAEIETYLEAQAEEAAKRAEMGPPPMVAVGQPNMPPTAEGALPPETMPVDE